MIVMIDSNRLDDAEAELSPHPVEQLLTPLTRYRRVRPDAHFAIDNGAFKRFDRAAFEALLAREYDNRHLCRFVCAPDVVASARRTLECFKAWRERLNDWPVALVAQDGQENLPIPWEQIDAIFIGGSTEFKESRAAVDIIKTAQILGKWTHVGRVNDPHRFDKFLELGVDSVDGTGLARYTWMRQRIATGFPLLEQQA